MSRSCLATDPRTAESILYLLHATNLNSAVIEECTSQLERVNAWLKGESSVSMQAGLVGTRLHSIGYYVKLVSHGLSSMLRGKPRTLDGSECKMEMLSPHDALTLIEMLLPSSTMNPENDSDSYRRSGSLIAKALHIVRRVIADASLAKADAYKAIDKIDCAQQPSSWPRTICARAGYTVELIGIDALHLELSRPGAGQVVMDEADMHAILRAAVDINSAQERMHGAHHLLHSCQSLLSILSFSAPSDGRITPRIALFTNLLELLKPLSPANPPPTSDEVSPTLTTCSLMLLTSLGDLWHLSTEVQHHIMSSLLAAFRPPYALSTCARTPIYLMLLKLLGSVGTTTERLRQPARSQLAPALGNWLLCSSEGLLEHLSMDVADGRGTCQIIALSLMSVLLRMQPIGEHLTVQLAVSGHLMRQTSVLASPSSSVSACLLNIITDRGPSFQGAWSSMWLFESICGVLTTCVQTSFRDQALNSRAAQGQTMNSHVQQNFMTMVAHVASSSFLDHISCLTLSVKDPKGKDHMKPHLMCRLILPLLYLLSAACAHVPSWMLTDILDGFLCSTERRVESLTQILHAPLLGARKDSACVYDAAMESCHVAALTASNLLCQVIGASLLTHTGCTAADIQTATSPKENSADGKVMPKLSERYILAIQHLIPALAQLLPAKSDHCLMSLTRSVAEILSTHERPIALSQLATGMARPPVRSLSFDSPTVSFHPRNDMYAMLICCNSFPQQVERDQSVHLTSGIHTALVRNISSALEVMVLRDMQIKSAATMPLLLMHDEPFLHGYTSAMAFCASLISWALDSIDVADNAYAMLSSVSHERIVSLNLQTLRCLIAAIANHLPAAASDSTTAYAFVDGPSSSAPVRARLLVTSSGARTKSIAFSP